jgi:NitT/TauT family transport system substrate-binding protein|tara:strand:+ start:779 stop:1699 length:921 start_codon:yes stop_codon:yes gene_type:complete
METLNLETTAPFQGLSELVAYNEGLFAEEGIDITWVDRDPTENVVGITKTINTDIKDPSEVDPHSSHGKLFEQGKADMYNACEWGNYCRVQDSGIESGRQIGRRSIVTFAGLVVRPESEVYTAQQLAGKLVGVPFYFGTHYLALHMLEGFLERDQITLCSAPNGSRHRYDAMMSGVIEATTLTEPYLTLAEKNGCRVVTSAFYHGTEVASDNVDEETYGKFNRAVCEAVKRINADKKKYLQYFIDYHKVRDPEIGTLTVSDLRESRIVVVEPAPIPEDELERTANWIKGWGMLTQTDDHNNLVRMT